MHKKESESGLVVTLQSVANAEKYVQIREGAVEGCGTGDELSELKVADCSEGLVSLESAKTTGQFIAVNEDGSVQLATETGPSAHFTVSSPTASKDAQAEATPQAESDSKESDATPQAEADPKGSEAAPAQSESDPTPTSTQQPQSESEPSETAQQEQQEQDPGTTAEAEPASS